MADKFFDAMFTASILGGSSGPAPVIVAKNITTNGTYSALDDQADGFNPVIVSVPNSYTAGDEGKVVSGGELVAQTSTTATANGTIDTTTNNEVVVDVPNSYTAGDEGKVVSNGALVAQTAYPTTITKNGTYNTTENNSVTVNVAKGTAIYNLSPLSAGITSSDLHYCKYGNYLYIFGIYSSTETQSRFLFTTPLSKLGISENIRAYVKASAPSETTAANFNLTLSGTTTELYVSKPTAMTSPVYVIAVYSI